MQSSLYGRRDVPSARFLRFVPYLPVGAPRERVRDRVLGVRHDGESELVRIVAHDKDRPDGEVTARNQSEEIDQRCPPVHGFPQPPVVTVIQIGAVVAAEQAMLVAERILVRAVRCRRDRQRDLRKDPGLEDAGRPNQWHALAVPLEALGG
ncbi:hypothetical protein [Arhodomonas sp. KWT]|uniref:hypothetical protein n=1 Tax=Arhodomonas sp. KWT TaxID=2679915 RepID=UPI0013D44528|nr:hypothetical protein [Arhodomonas sp. KWT]